MFGAIYAAEGSDGAVLEGVAREFSPRIEVFDKREIALDLNGVARLFGNGREIAAAIRTTAADRGLRVRVAIADTRTAARLLVHHRAGITVIAPGTEAEVLAPLPLTLLRTLRPLRPNDSNDSNDSNDPNASNASNGSNDLVLTLRRWGLRTLGEFAALPADAVAARLGQEGVWWQRVAAGEDPLPLVPSVPEERFEQALELEWPIDGLEPLSFVLGRLMEPLERHLEQRDRGAAVLHVRLYLVKGAGDRGAGDKEAGETENGTRRVHERTLQLPTPIRDARTLRTLALLDLESHPPSAAIDRVVVAVDPTPGRIVQYSLLTRPLPSPEQISTLMARLNALMGDGTLRCARHRRFLAARRVRDGCVQSKGCDTRQSRTAATEARRHRGCFSILYCLTRSGYRPQCLSASACENRRDHDPDRCASTFPPPDSRACARRTGQAIAVDD